MKNRDCPCPYLPCKLRNNCAACIAKSRKEGTLTNCMEDIAISHGAQLPLRQAESLVLADPAAVAEYCAQEILDCVRARPDALLCLPAGETAVQTFSQVVKMAGSQGLDFSAVRFVALDEWLDLGDAARENCEAFMRRNLYTPLGIREEQIKFFDINRLSPQEACEDMEAFLKAQGPIDLMLLGIGMNGHVGLNEPGDSFDQGAHVVDLDPVTMEVGQKYFTGQAPLRRGITLGMRHVFDAKRVILQAVGAKKAAILAEMYAMQPGTRLPATVMVLHSNSLVVMDKAAAQRIDFAGPAQTE